MSLRVTSTAHWVNHTNGSTPLFPLRCNCHATTRYACVPADGGLLLGAHRAARRAEHHVRRPLVLFLPPAQCNHGLTQWAAGVKMCDCQVRRRPRGRRQPLRRDRGRVGAVRRGRDARRPRGRARRAALRRGVRVRTGGRGVVASSGPHLEPTTTTSSLSGGDDAAHARARDRITS